MAKFLQWNCRGYLANYEELTRLIDKHHPKVICLQELMICNRKIGHPTDYQPPLTSTNRGHNDRGGAAIIIHKSVPYKKIPLTTNLHAVAAVVYLGSSSITVCSVYLAPSCPYTEHDLFTLFQQLPPHVMILGDFNLSHPAWGDTTCSPRADWLLNNIDTFQLGCLNTGLPTYERLYAGTSSCIDVSLCSLNIVDRYEWSRSPFLHGSDHYPIFIQTLGPALHGSSSPTWRYHRAN